MSIIGSFPFILMVVDEKGHNFIQLNKARIFEAILISCITGVIAGSLVGWRDLSSLKTSVENIKTTQDKMMKETKEEFRIINQNILDLYKEKRK